MCEIEKVAVVVHPGWWCCAASVESDSLLRMVPVVPVFPSGSFEVLHRGLRFAC